MLLVAGSGVVGRYIYTRLHAHMDGNEDTLEQLKAVGNRLRTQTTSIAFLRDFWTRSTRWSGNTSCLPKAAFSDSSTCSPVLPHGQARWALNARSSTR